VSKLDGSGFAPLAFVLRFGITNRVIKLMRLTACCSSFRAHGTLYSIPPADNCSTFALPSALIINSARRGLGDPQTDKIAASIPLGLSNRTARDPRRCRSDADARCYSVTFVKSVRPMRSPTPDLSVRIARRSRDPPRDYQRWGGEGEGGGGVHTTRTIASIPSYLSAPAREKGRASRYRVWVMTNRFRGPVHPSRPLELPLDTNRSCRTVTFVRAPRISSIDRSPKRFVLFFDGAFITLATALNRPVFVRSRETKAVCHYRCCLLVELSGTS